MKYGFLATASAVALLAGIGAASAQSGGNEMRGGAEIRGGGAGTQVQEKGEIDVKKRGSGAQVQEKGGVDVKKPGGGAQIQEKGGVDVKKPGMSQQQDQEKPRKGEHSQQRDSGKPGATTTQRIEEQQKTQTQTQGSGSGQVTGQSKTSASVSLSQEQRTKIRTTIFQQKVQRVTNVNFSIAVGVKVPRTVHLYPLPVVIIEIVPAYRGYLYFIVGDEIVIVDPVTLEIVAVLPA